MAASAPCLCSICITGTYEDEHGRMVPGTLQSPRNRKVHAIEDRKRELADKRAAEDSEEMRSSILLATMNHRPTRPRYFMSAQHEEDHLPERAVDYRAESSEGNPEAREVRVFVPNSKTMRDIRTYAGLLRHRTTVECACSGCNHAKCTCSSISAAQLAV